MSDVGAGSVGNKDAGLAAALAAERARHAQTAAELAALKAHVSGLEQLLAATPSSTQRQNVQLLALVQNLRLGLVLVSPDGAIQFVNQYFWELFGIPPVRPREGQEGIDPEDFRIGHLFHDPEAFRARAWQMHREGKTVLQEEFVLADGRVVELDYLVLDTVQAGRLICYRDVTERHQRTAQLHTLAYYLPQHTPSPILRLTAAGEVMYANPAAEPLRPELTAQAVLPALAQGALGAPSEACQQELTLAGQHYVASAVAIPGQPYVTLYLTNDTARHESAQQLAEQRDFYETILSVLPVEMTVFDGQQRCLLVNPAVIPDPLVRQQALGLSLEAYFALRGQQQARHLNEQRKSYFELAIRTQRGVSYEETRLDEKGREKLIMRQIWPVYQPDGQLRMLVGIGIDITARMLAEKLQQQVQRQLQEREDFIRQIVDAVPNVVYLVEPDGHITFSNQAFRAMIPRSTHLVPQEQGETVRAEMQRIGEANQQVLATGRPVIEELPFTMESGETIFYHVHKLPLERPNGSTGVLTVSTDVTAVKRAREELERREKQYHDLVYYSQALICTHDLQGVLLTVNPAVERLTSLPAARLVGRNLVKALLPERREAFQAYLQSANEPQPQPRLVTIRISGGQVRYLQYYRYLVSEPGQVPYVVASGYDVTEGYLAQQALQQAKQQAEENARAKEEFLSRMSHEIRTPLNGVLGMATLLQKTGLTAPQQEYLNTMQRAGQHLLALVNDVLDMAKITTQPPQLEQQPFDLGVVLHGAAQMVAALAGEKGLRLLITPLDPAVRVVGDAYRLHQVLLNLLSNAIKFTAQGSVRLGAEVQPDPAGGVRVTFRVTDTGIGMTPAEQTHIFDAFTQANADTSRHYGGTGLGLAISHQLVEQMGGVLRVSSAPGAGATFSFQLTLPRAAAPPAAPPPAAPPAARYEALRGLRVLVAEDNLVNQWIAVVVLEHWGVQVTAVSNGSEALTKLREQDFDAAVLDIRMPGLSGLEVTTAVRSLADARRARLPIIAVTANAFDSEQASYLAAGMDACVTKPYQEEDLCQVLLDLTRPRP